MLSDQDIERFLNRSVDPLVIDPIADRSVQIQPASVDLRLSRHFQFYRISSTPYIDSRSADTVKDCWESVTLKQDVPLVIHPGEFVLGSTVERIELPADLSARVEGRSSFGRLAVIVHATAGFIDPGFCGEITLEIANLGRIPVVLHPGDRVCQICFFQLSSPARRPYGPERSSKYQHQVGAQPSRIGRDQRTS